MSQEALQHTAEKKDTFARELDLVKIHFDVSATREACASFIRGDKSVVPATADPGNAVDLVAQMQ